MPRTPTTSPSPQTQMGTPRRMKPTEQMPAPTRHSQDQSKDFLDLYLGYNIRLTCPDLLRTEMCWIPFLHITSNEVIIMPEEGLK